MVAIRRWVVNDPIDSQSSKGYDVNDDVGDVSGLAMGHGNSYDDNAR